MYLFHDSRQAAYRSPLGAAPTGAQVTLGLQVTDCTPSRVLLRLWDHREILVPMTEAQPGHYQATITLPETPGLLWYYFLVEAAGETLCYAHPQGSQQGTGALTTDPQSWQITVYTPTELPAWYRDALVYQIFPDRFARGADFSRCQEAAAKISWRGTRRLLVSDWDDTPFYCKDPQGRVTRWPFFGGTLRGILEKLPYLQSLGVGVIYLNPIFLAASNHKYDTADYLQLDPGFGTEADFTALCQGAEAAGIRIILDGVFSHTGDDSRYFNRWGTFPQPGAYGDEPSPYDSWYQMDDSLPQGYACWWGVDALPNTQELDPTFLEYICGENGVIRKWLRLGASGWRLDVADELPDDFIAQVRAAAKAEKPDALILGEVWEDASNKISYGALRKYFWGQELDCTMHYPFREGVLNFLLGRQTGQELADALASIQEHYPPSAQAGALNLAGTHDTPRVLTLLGEAPLDLPAPEQEGYRLPPAQLQLGRQRLKLMDVLLFTCPGVPCIYYGDEAGAQGYPDPYNRGPFPWGREDGDLQYHVRMLSHLRREYPVLAQGSARYFSPAPGVFALERQLGSELAIIYVNRSQEPQTISGHSQELLDLLSGEVREPGSLTLAPLSAQILHRSGTQPCHSPLPAYVQAPKGLGVLCPLFSLPGPGKTGTLGKSAYDFLEALHRGGYQSWMLLPLCPAGEGNSPYSSPGIFAGDPRYIDPDIPVPLEGLEDFCRENAHWLEDYALYRVLRDIHGGPWQTWPWRERDRKNLAALRRRYAQALSEIYLEQYRFDYQFRLLRARAEALGISLIGDLPIYAALDGADTWANREEFLLDAHGYPTLRAGCPPDYFAPQGQDWGNPLYHWSLMQKNGYRWWKNRLGQALGRFHQVRLDHFRGFAAYYAIPAGLPATQGYWMKGPGRDFFREMGKALGTLPILAEDLGTLDSQVTVLLRETGLPGMNVWQFTPEEMAHMPPEEAQHRVFFSGTHDNQTLSGFLHTTGDPRTPGEILQELRESPAAAVIFPVQDILGLGDEARINVPGVPTGNWTWRMTPEMLQQLSDD